MSLKSTQERDKSKHNFWCRFCEDAFVLNICYEDLTWRPDNHIVIVRELRVETYTKPAHLSSLV
eukprot:2021197-Amphidinium_carterae.1